MVLAILAMYSEDIVFFRKGDFMQTQTQRFNPRSFVGIAAVAGGLGILAHFGGQMWAAQPATIAPQIAAPAQAEPVTLTLDALLTEAVALVGMPVMGDATEAAIEARWGPTPTDRRNAHIAFWIAWA